MNKLGTPTHSPMSTASRRIAALAAAALALCVGTAMADTPDWSRYSNHFSVAFTGYTGAPLKNFPALVRLSSALNGFDYSKSGSNGSNLRFSDADGNLIPCEIDTWDASGTSLVWVKVPNLTRLTVVYGHYGCATPDSMNPNDVWDENYVGVWHLGESSLPLKESSGVSTPFSRATGEFQSNPSAHFAATGVVGKCFKLNGGSANCAVFAADDPDLTGFQNLTMEFWVRQDATFSYSMSLLGKAATGSSDYSYRGYVGKNTQDLEMLFSFNDSGTGTGTLSYKWTFPALNTWYYYAFAYDHATHTRHIRRDGSALGSYDTQTFGGPIFDSNADFSLGGAISGTTPFKGQIDELRISKIARSPEWLKATYDTVHNASFATYGAGNDWIKYARKFYITFPGAPSGTLTDFPVLVRVAANSPEGFSYADCLRGNGEDLRFSDADGNILASEVDTWDVNGTSLIWVKVPTLTSSTKITAYYGWDKAPGVDGTRVWDANYVGVWHLGENALPLKESSGNSTPFATSTGSGISYNAGGSIGAALNLANAASGSAIYAADDPAYTDLDNFSFEYWLKQTAKDTSTTMCLLQQMAGYNTDMSYRVYIPKNSTRPNYQFSANGTASDPLLLSGNIWTDPPLNTWYYHAWTYNHPTHTRLSWKDGSKIGAYDAQTRSAPIHNSASPLSLGGGFSGANPFKGLIDELRISKVARSETWLKATYDTVKTASFANYSKTRVNDSAFMMIFR